MRIALAQTTTGIDPAANAEGLIDAVRRAAEGDAAMLFTPEMSGFLDRDRERARSHIRPEACDPVLAAVRDAAARHRIWVHLGSLAIDREDGRCREVFRVRQAEILKCGEGADRRGHEIIGNEKKTTDD